MNSAVPLHEGAVSVLAKLGETCLILNCHIPGFYGGICKEFISKAVGVYYRLGLDIIGKLVIIFKMWVLVATENRQVGSQFSFFFTLELLVSPAARIGLVIDFYAPLGDGSLGAVG